MRALTMDELEWVSGAGDNVYTGPSSPLGCSDTARGCDENGFSNMFQTLENQGGSEDVTVYGTRGGGGGGGGGGGIRNMDDLGACVGGKVNDSFSSFTTVWAALQGAAGFGSVAMTTFAGAGAGAVSVAAITSAIVGAGAGVGMATAGYLAWAVADCAVHW